MAAITWRNVMGPSVADAARPMELARQGFNDAFGRLNALIDERQASSNLKAKEDFLDKVYAAATPEELQAMQSSGVLNAAMAGLAPEVRAQVRGAADSRLTALRDAATKGFQYSDAVEDRSTRDARAEAEAAILRGDPNAEALIKALPSRFQGTQLKAQDERGQILVDRERSATRFTRDGEKHDADMLAAADSLKTAAAQRALYGAHVNQANMSTSAAKMEMARSSAAAQADEQERQRAMVRTALAGENSFYKDFITPEKNIAAVTQVIGGRKLNSDQEDNLRTALGKSMYHTYKTGDGQEVRVPVPLSILETAAQTSSTGNGWLWNNDDTVSKNFTAKVNALMKEHAPEVLRDYEALTQLKRFNIENPPASASGKK